MKRGKREDIGDSSSIDPYKSETILVVVTVAVAAAAAVVVVIIIIRRRRRRRRRRKGIFYIMLLFTLRHSLCINKFATKCNMTLYVDMDTIKFILGRFNSFFQLYRLYSIK
jgi:hypothetical protein